MSDIAAFIGTKSIDLTEDHIISVLLVRRARARIMGEGLFADPAWDILLQLFAAELGERSIDVNELAAAIDMPLSTTTRWITALEGQDLVERTTSSAGSIVSLSEKGRCNMNHLGSRWASAFAAIG